MNYLAHLYLADTDPESWIGSLMGDFVKGRVPSDLPAAVRFGVLLHRRVDSFTDAHAIVRRGKERTRPEYRRYAGILLDLFYDHFLALRWSRHCSVPLEEFAHQVYRALQANQHGFPASMQRSMNYMVSNDLLQSYREMAGIERALKGIDTRLKRPIGLGDAIVELETHYCVLEEDFAEFFPELIRFVQRFSMSADATSPPLSTDGRRGD